MPVTTAGTGFGSPRILAPGFLGFCFPHPRPVDGLPSYRDAAYIGAIGVHQAYRGERLSDTRSIGDFLLHDVLMQLELIYAGAMPAPGRTAAIRHPSSAR
jgi:hypothetical protein